MQDALRHAICFARAKYVYNGTEYGYEELFRAMRSEPNKFSDWDVVQPWTVLANDFFE